MLVGNALKLSCCVDSISGGFIFYQSVEHYFCCEYVAGLMSLTIILAPDLARMGLNFERQWRVINGENNRGCFSYNLSCVMMRASSG